MGHAAESGLFSATLTIIDGEEVRRTVASRTYKRWGVLVKNAPIDNGGFEDFPNFTEEEKKRFANKGVMPLIEIQYWLGWSNKLRIDSNYDLPTRESILGFLGATLSSYSKEESISSQMGLNPDVDNECEYALVPIHRFRSFLEDLQGNSSSLPDRVTIVEALDEFVGLYINGNN